MSPFNKFNIFYLALAAVLLFAIFYWQISAWYILLYLLFYLLIAGYFSWDIQFDFHFKTINKAETTEKIIAITFDDGPSKYSPEVLSVLAKHKAKASFFCIGKNIEAHPEILRQIHDAGHIIGNHTYNHGFFFDFLPASKMIAETDKTDALIEKTIGKKPLFFRPPYGISNPAVKNTVQAKDYKTIAWSIRSMDTVNKNIEKVQQKIIANLHPGAILLFHDNHDRIVPLLEQTIKAIYAKGYKIVPLDQLIKSKPYA